MLTANYSQSAGPIWLTDVVCSGNEDNIMDCRIEADTGECDHMMDAGVICVPTGIETICTF